MPTLRLPVFALTALLSAGWLSLVSCVRHKPVRAFQLPMAPRSAPLPPMPVLPSPPPFAVSLAGEKFPGEILEALTPPLEPPDSSSHRARRRATSQPASGGLPETPAPPAPAQTMRLGSMFTPEQKQELTKQVEGNISRVRRNLSLISRRRLNSGQQETAGQIAVFLEQAQAAKASDLEAARSLSERAELLSRDLLRTLR